MNLKRFALLFLPILIIGYGVFFEDLNTALDELLKNPCEYPLDINTYSIAVSPTDQVWAVTDNALYEYDGETWQPHLEPYIYIDDVLSVVIEFDPQGRLWLGHDDGMMIYDGGDWTFYEPEDWGLPRTKVTSIAFAPDGTAWVGLARSGSLRDDPGGGIIIFDGETWTTFHTRFAGMTTYDDISAIQFDPQGRPWIGTSMGTVSVIEEIISFSVGGGSLSTFHLPEENVISSTVDEDGATHYTAFTAQTYSRMSTPQMPIRGEIYSIDFDDRGDAWIYIYKNLYRFDGEDFKLMQTTEWDSMGKVAIDPQGNVWFGLKVYNGHWWRTYSDKNSCISSTVYNIAFDHSGAAWVAHTYDYHRKIGVTTFENPPYRIPLMLLGIRAILVPSAPAFRCIIPAVLAGVWLLIFLKLDWLSIARLRSWLRENFSFQEIHPDDKRWYQAVLAGLPYFTFLISNVISPDLSRWIHNLESMYKGYSFEILIFLPFFIIIPFLLVAWRRGWPIWSGSWAGFGAVFIFLLETRTSWLLGIVLPVVLLFVWLRFRDRKTGVLGTLPLTVILSYIFFYSYGNISPDDYYFQLLLLVLSFTAFVIVLVRKWPWAAMDGLLISSFLFAYTLLKSDYSNTQLLFIPIYVALLYSVTFLPLLLCRKPRRVDGEDK